MTKSRHLRLHIWQEIVYFLLVAVAPAAVTCVEVFQSHNSMFQITFSSIGSILLLVIILRRFVLRNWIDKVREKCVLLEHDYSIDVGNQSLCKRQWAINNMILYIYSTTVLVLSVVLAYFLLNAIYEQVIQFRGAAVLILFFVLIAVVFKLACYIAMYKSTTKAEVEDEK